MTDYLTDIALCLSEVGTATFFMANSWSLELLCLLFYRMRTVL